MWRPSQQIRVLALGLHFKDGAILASEVLDDRGRVTGIRPLGGGVDFGETWKTALRREFHEELGAEIDVTGVPIVMENLFQHEGQSGHEIIFAAPITFNDPSFVAQDALPHVEEAQAGNVARWFDWTSPNATKSRPLFPIGLAQALANHPL